MIKLTINGKPVTANDGATILEAARSAGIDIPTMCYYNKTVAPVSCFICVVKVDGHDNFLPSCATAARDGMVVSTDSEDVRGCRRRALELMLSDHAGDCEAPCSRICPCGLDIPEVTRRLQSGNINAAMEIVRQYMPFPATLGRVCPAPCQKGCRRSSVDTALPIRDIHRIIAENAINTPLRNNITGIAPIQKNVAIIGSGPAGLSSAYFLALKGYPCTVFESQPETGGTLRSEISASILPRNILDAEIKLIENIGVKFIINMEINSIDEIHNDYDAIIIATGLRNEGQQQFGVEYDERGIKIFHDTFAASVPKVFACGSAARPVRFASRSAGQGRLIAISVDNYLRGGNARKPFFMNAGHLSSEETESLANSIPRIGNRELSTESSGVTNTDGINNIGGDTIDIVGESSRCLQCDCGKKNSCSLRDYAAQYGAHHLRYATGQRKRYTRKRYESGLVHEPGKCIACGRCVNITREKNINPGLAFSGRGADVHVTAPFGTPIDEAIGEALAECVSACPVGALWKGTP